MAALEIVDTYLDEMVRKYEALENCVLGGGTIQDFISLKQINQVLQNATDRLPSDIFVLYTPEDRTEVISTLDAITIYGFFEIASTNIFELVHITPVPLQRNDTFIIPTVNYRTMALNHNDQVFFELDEVQLAACHLIKENRYLCDAPFVTTMNFTACSLLTMMYNRTAHEACEYTAMSISGILLQKLLMPTSWLFITNEPTPISIICNSQREDLQFSGTGIISLDGGCILKTPSHAISSVSYLRFKVTETYFMEAALYLGELSITKFIQLQDPLPITNPTAVISGTIKAGTTFPAWTVICSQVPWLTLSLIMLMIYLYQRKRSLKKSTGAAEELQPINSSLGHILP